MIHIRRGETKKKILEHVIVCFYFLLDLDQARYAMQAHFDEFQHLILKTEAPAPQLIDQSK